MPLTVSFVKKTDPEMLMELTFDTSSVDKNLIFVYTCVCVQYNFFDIAILINKFLIVWGDKIFNIKNVYWMEHIYRIFKIDQCGAPNFAVLQELLKVRVNYWVLCNYEKASISWAFRNIYNKMIF